MDIPVPHKGQLMTFVQQVCQLYLGNRPVSLIDTTYLDQEILSAVIRDHKLQAIFREMSKSHDLGLSQNILARLKQREQKLIFQKLFQVKEILSIQRSHEEQGIYIVPYKGITIGELFYGNINQRDFVDIDFAVEEKDLALSASIMQDLGYKQVKENSDFTELKKSRSYHIDYAWVKYSANGKFVCPAEIHWQATNSALYSPVAFRELSSISEQTKILSTELRLFTKVENAYLMILHHGMVDNWFQLRHLVDLVVTVRALSADELAALLSRLKETKLLTCFYYGVQLSRDILQVELAQLEQPALAKYNNYLSAVKSGLLQGKWSENKKKLFYYLLLHDNHGERMKSIIKFIKYSIRELRFRVQKA